MVVVAGGYHDSMIKWTTEFWNATSPNGDWTYLKETFPWPELQVVTDHMNTSVKIVNIVQLRKTLMVRLSHGNSAFN